MPFGKFFGRKGSTSKQGNYTKLLEIYSGVSTPSPNAAGNVNRTPRSARRIVIDPAFPIPRPKSQQRRKEGQWLASQKILLHIFGYLGVGQLFLGVVEDPENEYALFDDNVKNVGSARLVCRQWATWSRQLPVVNLRFLRTKLLDKHVQRILNLLPQIKDLSLVECRRIKFIHFSFDTCRFIEVLNLSGCCQLTDEALKRITLQLPMLRELYIESCNRLVNVEVESLRDGAVKLEVLDLSCCSKVASATVNRLFGQLPNLRELFLSSVDTLDSSLAIGGPSLELLVLDRCASLPWKTVRDCLQRCTSLRFLSCSECELFQEEKLLTLPPMGALEELSMSGAYHNDETIASAVQGMPKLRILDMGNSENVIAPIFPPSCGLQFLILNQCCNLTDKAVELAARNLLQLKHLSVNSCDSLVRPTIDSPSLTLLDLSNCLNLLSDATRNGNWIRCPKLDILFLGFNPELTDQELEALVPNLRMLREFNLFRASGLRQPKLDGLDNLEVINFNECWNLVEGYVEELVLPRLKTIYVTFDEVMAPEDEEPPPPDDVEGSP